MTSMQIFIVALVTGLPAIITSITGLLVVLYKIRALHKHVNSRLDELIRAEKMVSFTAGGDAERNTPTSK